MPFFRHPPKFLTGLLLVAGVLCAGAVRAADAMPALEQALDAARQSQRGITLYVNGQTIGGAVVRVDTSTAPGWVELRNQQHGRIVVRLDRIDGAALP